MINIVNRQEWFANLDTIFLLYKSACSVENANISGISFQERLLLQPTTVPDESVAFFAYFSTHNDAL